MNGTMTNCSSGRRLVFVLAATKELVLYDVRDPEEQSPIFKYRKMSREGFERRFPKCKLQQ